ncbi:MAG: LiaF domain-containing protein [Actinomycetota bacterium]
MSDAVVPQPSDADPVPFEVRRQAVIDQIQQALAEDHIEFDEIDDRFAAVYAAEDRAALEAVAADLPELDQPPPPVDARHLAPVSRFALVGDVKVGGWLTVEEDMTIISGVGDITVDLSSAAIGDGGVTVKTWSLVGDTRVIVPDGARVQVETISVLGDDAEAVTPPIGNGPVVRVRSFSLIGDTSVYSLSLVPVGALRRLWSALRK